MGFALVFAMVMVMALCLSVSLSLFSLLSLSISVCTGVCIGVKLTKGRVGEGVGESEVNKERYPRCGVCAYIYTQHIVYFIC